MPRNGKIARLPSAVRNVLNQRLFNGQSGPDILNWANALPEVQSILVQHFAGHPINLQNLSEWRQGGFEEWLLREDISLQSGRCGEDADSVAAVGPVLKNLCTVLTTKYVSLFYEWDRLTDEQLGRKLRYLGSYSRQIVVLRKLDHEQQQAEFAAQRAKKELEAIQRRQAELTAPEDAPGDEEPEMSDEDSGDQTSRSKQIKPHQTGSSLVKPAAVVTGHTQKAPSLPQGGGEGPLVPRKPGEGGGEEAVKISPLPNPLPAPCVAGRGNQRSLSGGAVAVLPPEFRVPGKDQTPSNPIKLSPDFLSLDPVPRLRPIHRDPNRRIMDEVVEKICAGREAAKG